MDFPAGALPRGLGRFALKRGFTVAPTYFWFNPQSTDSLSEGFLPFTQPLFPWPPILPAAFVGWYLSD